MKGLSRRMRYNCTQICQQTVMPLRANASLPFVCLSQPSGNKYSQILHPQDPSRYFSFHYFFFVLSIHILDSKLDYKITSISNELNHKVLVDSANFRDWINDTDLTTDRGYFGNLRSWFTNFRPRILIPLTQQGLYFVGRISSKNLFNE